MDENKRKIYMAIHSAIHNPIARGVKVNGTLHEIQYSSFEGLRQIHYEGETFIQQNPDKQSKWAELARQDHKITWVIRNGTWGRIVDEQIEAE